MRAKTPSFTTSRKQQQQQQPDADSVLSATALRMARRSSTIVKNNSLTNERAGSFINNNNSKQQQQQQQQQQLQSPLSPETPQGSNNVDGSFSREQDPTSSRRSKSFIALNRKKAALTPAKTAAATAAKEWKNWEVEDPNQQGQDETSQSQQQQQDSTTTNNSNDENQISTTGGAEDKNNNNSSATTNTTRKKNSSNENDSSNKNKSSSSSNKDASSTSSSKSLPHQITLRRRYRGVAATLQQHDDNNNNTQRGRETSSGETSVGGLQRTVENAASLVARSPLFTTLRDRRVIDRIAETVKWYSALPGQYIVVAGDVATSMFFIFSGFVEILLPVSEEEETPVATLQGGDFFGEIALVSKEKTLRTASVQAAKHCELLVLSRSDLEEVIAVSDELRECLELEANKRLASLRQREQKLISDEVDVDRELLRRATSNPLSAIECEWRMLTKARIRGSHRTHPAPVALPDVMTWARYHAQHTPWPFHGRTTSALSKLPTEWLAEEKRRMTVESSVGMDNHNSQENSNNPLLLSAGTSSMFDNNNNDADHQQHQEQLLLLHPEMGCVYKYSTVIDSLAGPDEFDNLCRSVVRLLSDTLGQQGAVLSKQALGALGLAAQIALFFSHSGKRTRIENLMNHISKRIDGLTPEQKSELSLSSETGLPSFTVDHNLLSEMSCGLFRAPCWSISSQLSYDQYPKSFVLSDAWAVVTLERIAALREECIKRISETIVDQMLERHVVIVRQWKAAQNIFCRKQKIQRLVIKKAMSMLIQVESRHREKVERDYDTALAGLWRWHECCLSFVSSQRTAQESALAGKLEQFGTFSSNSGYSSSRRSQQKAPSSSASARETNNNNNHHQSSSPAADQTSLSFFTTSRSRARSAGVSASSSLRGGTTNRGSSSASSVYDRNGVALLVAQKERMADEAIHFQKRVKTSRF